MLKSLIVVTPVLMALSTACGGGRPAASVTGTESGTGTPLRVQGPTLVDKSGNPVILRGVAFGNQVWSDIPIPTQHHGEIDYQRVADMGMNSVRFYLNYRTFQKEGEIGRYEREEGWQWLDQNIAWAKQHGIYLVLNMHVPPGGYQSGGKGTDLWDKSEVQEHFIALWQAIATRYRGEETIAGYDLLNEAVVTRGPEQWHDLAARTVRAVRAVDPGHAVFIERVNAAAGDWKEDENRNFFRIDDPNAVYEFHFYKPFHFTHQNASWVDFAAESGVYPDESKVGVEWFFLDWKTGTHESPRLPAGDSDWTYYEGKPLRVDDSKLVVGKPALVCNANSGRAFFDDLVLEELDADGQVKRELYRIDLTTKRGWYLWSQDNVGTLAQESTGHGDASSLSISGTKTDANAGGDPWRFRTEPGATYRLSGWMRGEQIPEGATCQIRLDLFSSRVPVFDRNKAFLAYELDAYVAWGKRENVPLYLGEFGAIRGAYEQDRGGLRWSVDMLDLLLERGLNFSYHDYHEESFGIYLGDGTLPDPKHANTALIELFTRKLAR